MVNRQILVAADKLHKSFVRLTTICASESARVTEKENCIRVALNLSQAMSHLSRFQSQAKDVCEKALLGATHLGFSPLIASALHQCGCLAAIRGDYKEAEQYIR